MSGKRCAVVGCERKYFGRGYCNTHYSRMRRGIPLGAPLPAHRISNQRSSGMRNPSHDEVLGRFFSYVELDGDCWLWTGGTGNRTDYGRFHEGGRDHVAHRWLREALVGPIPEGLVLDHLCRRPACVNPDHVEPVTQRENVRRGAGGRFRGTTCRSGHLASTENTYLDAQGYPACAMCRRIHVLRHRAKRRAGVAS